MTESPLSDIVPSCHGKWWKNELQFGPEFAQYLRSDPVSSQVAAQDVKPNHQVNRVFGKICRETDMFPKRKSFAPRHHFQSKASRYCRASLSLFSAQTARVGNRKTVALDESSVCSLPRLLQSPLTRNLILNKAMNPGFIAERQSEMIRNSWNIIDEGEKALSVFLRDTEPCSAKLGSKMVSAYDQTGRAFCESPSDGSGSVTSVGPSPASPCDCSSPARLKPRLAELLKPPAAPAGLQRAVFRSHAGRASDRAFASTAGARANHHARNSAAGPRQSLDTWAAHGGVRLLLPPTVPW